MIFNANITVLVSMEQILRCHSSQSERQDHQKKSSNRKL